MMEPLSWSALQRRFALAVVIVASIWFALALGWGLLGRIAPGHDAVVASRAIAAENMLTWKIFAPVREFTIHEPTANDYYVHHPWGTFWAIAALMAVLGRHAFVPRLFAIAMSVSTPPLLYGIGLRLWGPLPAAVAALSYTALPITLAFGNFPGFEVPLVTCCLLGTWGFVRFAEHWKRRWMVVSLIGVLASVNMDWESLVYWAFDLVTLIFAIFFLRIPRVGSAGSRRFAQWAFLAALAAVATTLLYVAYFVRIKQIASLIDGEMQRSRGGMTPLMVALGARAHWIDEMFTPLAVLVGKIGTVLFLVCVFVRRRLVDVFPLGLLAMATYEYVKFKNGADVHIYWPLPFAPYFALAVGALAWVLTCLTRRAQVVILHKEIAGAAGWGGFVVAALVALAMIPDAVSSLRYCRATGGRFDERGIAIRRDEDQIQALEWMALRLVDKSTVLIHPDMRASWAQQWALHRPIVSMGAAPPPRANDGHYFVGDLGSMPAAEQRDLFDKYAVVAVGPYVFVDLAAPWAPAEAYVFDQREPGWFEWYFRSGVAPVRSIRADPWVTWELREHLGQTPNLAPSGLPVTLDEVRIAHNAALAAGDEQLATGYKNQMDRRVDMTSAMALSDGTRLLGTHVIGGVAPSLSIYFLALHPLDANVSFNVYGRVFARSALSLVPADPVIRRVGTSVVPSPMLWRPGFIYVESCDLLPRPGHELFFGDFGATARTIQPPVARRNEAIRLWEL